VEEERKGHLHVPLWEFGLCYGSSRYRAWISVTACSKSCVDTPIFIGSCPVYTLHTSIGNLKHCSLWAAMLFDRSKKRRKLCFCDIEWKVHHPSCFSSAGCFHLTNPLNPDATETLPMQHQTRCRSRILLLPLWMFPPCVPTESMPQTCLRRLIFNPFRRRRMKRPKG